MNPKDQLIKEIEKLRITNIYSGWRRFSRDDEKELISTIKDFFTDKVILEKGDLLTNDEYEHLGSCKKEDCSKCEMLARRHYRFRKSLVKTIKEKGE